MFDTEVAQALDRAAVAARAECAAVAAKLAAASEVARLRREADGRDQVPVGRRAEFVAVEVATALAVSTGVAHGLIELGETLAVRLPGTRRALERGELDLARVRVVADRTACIADLGMLARVERRVLEVVVVPGRCVTRGQVARVVDRAVAAVDPDLVVARRVRAEVDRDVVVRPDADGMCSLWGALPALGGVAVEDRVRALALGVCGQDPRTLAQRRADALVAMAHGDRYLACECGSPVCPTAQDADAVHHRCRPVIQVVVPVQTLLGAADLPGVLGRFGVVDPERVRALAADARWQQLLTLDGVAVHLGRSTVAGTVEPAALRYTPSDALAGMIRSRDGHCRFPGCTTPSTSCDLDHVVAFDHADPRRGGHTVAENLACLCRWHHRAKTEGHWQVRMEPDATQHWSGPSRQQLHSVPAGMPARSSPPQSRPPCRPTLTRTSRALTRAQLGRHPDHDLRPDDTAPNRWAPDGRWADDTATNQDLDATLDHLVAEIDRTTRQSRARIPARTVPPVQPHDPGPRDSDTTDPPPF